ncbi:MAG: spondin domain-containing protein [Bdellovibrionales bacterium]|nr:spondin domain-containing protein [Bdellovibrionales bacterium]
MNRFTLSGLITAAALVAQVGSATEVVKFKVTVQNVTANNVLSPYFAYVLPKGASHFALGKAAPAGIAEVAETGSTATLEKELAERGDVLASAKADGVTRSGESKEIEISVDKADLYKGAALHLVAMIGRSNDSFITSRAVPLYAVAKSYGGITFHAVNLDAGSEENTGNVEDFGPGGHPTMGAEGKISYDRGLNPRGTAPESFAWGDTAAIISVKAVH